MNHTKAFPKSISKYHKIIDFFSGSFTSLGKNVPGKQIEYLSSLVYQVMSARNRRYHTIDHVLITGANAEPIITLSILFHDIVYTQVDKRIHPLLDLYLKEFYLNEKFETELPRPPKDLEVVYDLFGMKTGDIIGPFTGQNEFLSAVVAVRTLQNHLNKKQIIQIVACIEATIPFRSNTASGESPADILFDRLKSVSQKYKYDIAHDELVRMVQQSVEVSNRDVSGFASIDPGFFVSQTWEIILEGNPIFRNPLFTIRQYRQAIQKVTDFHAGLKIHTLFKTYSGFPIDSDMKELINRAQTNQQIQIQYLNAKLVSVGLIEALAILTGGDAPYVLFIGTFIGDSNNASTAIEHFLNPISPVPNVVGKNPIAMSLLKFGRTNPSAFDFRHSPLESFLYESISNSSFESVLSSTKYFFNGQISAIQLIKEYPQNTITHVISAIAEVAITRKQDILDVLSSITNL